MTEFRTCLVCFGRGFTRSWIFFRHVCKRCHGSGRVGLDEPLFSDGAETQVGPFMDVEAARAAYEDACLKERFLHHLEQRARRFGR